MPRVTPNPRLCWVHTLAPHPSTTLGASTLTSQGPSLSITAPNFPLAHYTPPSFTPTLCRAAFPSCLTPSPHCCPQGRQVGVREGKPEGQTARRVVSPPDCVSHPTREACPCFGRTLETGHHWGRGIGESPILPSWGWDWELWESGQGMGTTSKAPQRGEGV